MGALLTCGYFKAGRAASGLSHSLFPISWQFSNTFQPFLHSLTGIPSHSSLKTSSKLPHRTQPTDISSHQDTLTEGKLDPHLCGHSLVQKIQLTLVSQTSEYCSNWGEMCLAAQRRFSIQQQQEGERTWREKCKIKPRPAGLQMPHPSQQPAWPVFLKHIINQGYLRG